MYSAVTSPHFPPPPQPSVKELAAAGYFRAIALWLNEPLAPQGIFVKVQADRPGCLRLLVEFEQGPIKERLLRFLCHRVWLLNSELIEGIHVIARPVGRRRLLWQKRIRIVTPALKRRKAVVRAAHPAQHNSPLPPQIGQKVAHLSNHRLKTLRALLLTGSAVAAFLFGCLLEVVTAGHSPTLPSFSAKSSHPPVADYTDSFATDHAHLSETLQATTIDYRASRGAADSDQIRSTVVDAALEPVAVIEHHQPAGQQSEDVTLLFGGDISLEDLAYDDLAEAGGLFSQVEEYLQADVSMVTLGSPLATAATTLKEELYDRNRPDAVNLLADSGVDIVNLTDDSLMEHGAQGLDETLKALDSKGIYRVGAGRNEMEARRPEVIDVKGKRIAYLSYSMGGDNAAFGDRAGLNAQDMREIVEDIQALRDEVDWIVVNYRWVEFVTKEPHFNQTNLARLAIDQGADVVVGYHPNVIQGAEVYKGRPIAYSVGDFVFETDKPIADQDSAIFKVSLKQDQMKVEFVPVRVQHSLPKTLDGPEGKAVLQKIEQASEQFDQPMKSPMVLDLKDKAPIVPDKYDPDSPFVSPEVEDTLPVEPVAPVQPEESVVPGADEDPNNVAPAEPSEAKPLPLEELDIKDQLDEELLEWGPKPSDGQREFHPIPQNRPDHQSEEMDAHLHPSLLRKLPPSNQPPPEPGASPAAVDRHSHEAPASPEPVTESGMVDSSESQEKPEAIAPNREPLVGPLSSGLQKERLKPSGPMVQVASNPLTRLSSASVVEAELVGSTLVPNRSH